jgi:hypothetical protein
MAGHGGVVNGFMSGSVYLTTTASIDGQARKRFQPDTSHNSWHEANRSAQCGKSARWVRCGGGWKRIYGLAIEALPEETGSKQIGLTFEIPRQSSTSPSILMRQPVR